jgi:hypothetical protein
MHPQEDVVPYYEAYHCFANMLKNSKLKVSSIMYLNLA